MPTATRRKPTNALTRLAELEAVQAEAHAKAKHLRNKYVTKHDRATELVNERRRLVHRDPSLILHNGEANLDVPDNPVAAIDAEILEVGDVDDLRAQTDHATAIAERADQAVREHVKANFDAIREGLKPVGQGHADQLADALDAVHVALDAYTGHAMRVMGLAAMARRDTQISGLDHAAALKRDLRDRKLEAPELYTAAPR